VKRWTLIAVMLPSLSAAQSVRGTVTEPESRRPIAGAVVFLVDANQAVVGRDLTNESGAYRLNAPRPGTYRVRTMRIGFRPVLSGVVQLSDGADVPLPLAVETVPVSLSAVHVERRANCPARQDATQAYNAWNEVATALHAALLSSRVRGTNATIVAYDRWTEPGSDVVLRQGANVRTGMPAQPWRSIGAEALHKNGFVVREANGWLTFHAPDLDVLLSDLFLEDHCLQLRTADNREIAIEFTPSRDRNRIAEIRGFVWLDAATLELKRLQFRYVNVSRAYEQADAGGDLEFLKLRNGTWVISKWQIRMPTAFKQDRGDSYAGLTPNPEVRATEVKTTGGDLLRVLQGDDTVWSLPPLSFEGKVLDSTTGRPIPGARVVVAGTTYSTVTDEFGRFRIDNVLPGAYAVRVYTRELDSLAGFHHTSAVFAKILAGVEIRVPSRDQLVAAWCPEIAKGTRETSGLIGMVLGVVRNQRDSTAFPGVEVSVEWTDVIPGAIDLTTVRTRTLSARTDGEGVYRVCGAPWDHRLKLATEFDGKLPPMDIRIGAGRVRRQDFWISR
jgi:protocatechuate 3,4-dioxygenase beta subunit